MAHHREEVTWLTTSVTAATNHRAAIRTETANDSRTGIPVAAVWIRPRAAIVRAKTRAPSRNRLARLAAGGVSPPAAVIFAMPRARRPHQPRLLVESCKVCKARAHHP